MHKNYHIRILIRILILYFYMHKITYRIKIKLPHIYFFRFKKILPKKLLYIKNMPKKTSDEDIKKCEEIIEKITANHNLKVSDLLKEHDLSASIYYKFRKKKNEVSLADQIEQIKSQINNGNQDIFYDAQVDYSQEIKFLKDEIKKITKTNKQLIESDEIKTDGFNNHAKELNKTIERLNRHSERFSGYGEIIKENKANIDTQL